jgi:hypothetical protein
MSYIVGATPKRGKRAYYGRSDVYPTRVDAKADPIKNKPAAQKRAAYAERIGLNNVQVIRCEGWGRPAKKRRATRR